MLNQYLHHLGLLDSARLDARDGEYRHVFCPHCGAFIPSQFRVLVEGAPGDDGMRFDCHECGRTGAVLDVVDYEPLFDPEPIQPHGRFVESEGDE